VLIAAVKRVKEPGCKYDEMLVLECGQGLNKSSALRALSPNADWFSDHFPLNVDAKQLIEHTLGKWIVEAAELAGKRKTEVEALKSTLSRQVDGPVRLAYAHLPVERARQFVVVGTTNSTAYLIDSTGARRFWPVKIEAFDVAKVLDMRDQLWAEAAYREATGESIRLKKELWPDAEAEQEKRREIDSWEGLIRKMLLETARGTDGLLRVPTQLVWGSVGVSTDRQDRSGSMRITDIMQRLGFQRTHVRVEGIVQVGFIGTGDGLELLPEGGKRREPGEEWEDDVPARGVDVPF
jgi:predicted P-loop ATPase